MKRSVLLALALVCVAGMAFGQMPGTIGVFTSCDATSCNFIDAGSLVQVFMVHVWTDGATASQFMLAPPAGWMHLGDTWYFPTVIGSSITGVSVAYGACLAGPICLGMANFFGAAVPMCTYFSIVADPTAPSGLIEGVDCGTPPAKFFPAGGHGIVNSDGICVSPVEDKTWGGVKALYR